MGYCAGSVTQQQTYLKSVAALGNFAIPPGEVSELSGAAGLDKGAIPPGEVSELSGPVATEKYFDPSKMILAECQTVNLATLTGVERARYWHRTLGGVNMKRLQAMATEGKVDGLNQISNPHEDFAATLEGKWRRDPIKRSKVDNKQQLTEPPYSRLFCDGMYGFSTKSVGGATGAYVFVCGSTKNIIVELYRTKDEFPILFEKVLIHIESKGFHVKRIHFDSAAEEISSNVQKLGAQYGFVLDPKPPNVWKEHGYQEKAVGDITRIMRQMMSLAPHLAKNFWGLALKYAAVVHSVVGQKSLGGETPRFAVTGRRPDLARMGIFPFGCPVYVEDFAPAGKEGARCSLFFNLGLSRELTSMYSLHAEMHKIYRHSRRICTALIKEYTLKERHLPTEVIGNEDTPPSIVPSALDIKPQTNEGAKPAIAFGKPQELGKQSSELDKFRNEWEDEILARDEIQIMADIDKPEKAPEKIQLKGQLKDPDNYTSESPQKKKKVDFKVAKDYSFDTKESKVAGSKDALMEAKAHLYKTEKKNMTVKEIADKFKIHPREIVFVNDWSDFGVKLNQKSKFTLKGTEVWIPARNYSRVECVQLEQLMSIAYLVCALNIHGAADKPINAAEALISEEHEGWWTAICAELKQWEKLGVTKTVKFADRNPNAAIIVLTALFDTKYKPNGDFDKRKMRQVGGGHILREGIDYLQTYAPTVSGVVVRIFYAIMAAYRVMVSSIDISTAYLYAKLPTLIYAWVPPYYYYFEHPELLPELRTKLRKLDKRQRQQWLKGDRKSPDTLLELCMAVYGIPSSGYSWWKHLEKVLTQPEPEGLAMIASTYDRCLFWKFKPPSDWLMVICWTDDLPYGGTEKMKQWFKTEILKRFKGTHVPCQDSFIGMEIVQDPEHGSIELLQSGLITQQYAKFEKYFSEFDIKPQNIPVRTENKELVKASDEEHNLARHLPFPSLVASMGYVATWTKPGFMMAHSALASVMTKWSIEHFRIALGVLMCLYADRFRGTKYGRANPKFDVLELYCYADANLQLPRSRGCYMVGLNGAWIEMKTAFQSTLQICTMGTEISECAKAAMAVLAIRFLMKEMGLGQHQPTIIYQDNQPAIRTMHNAGSMSNASRHLQMRILKMKELEGDQFTTKFCLSQRMLVDIGTKFVPAIAFWTLNDAICGYSTAPPPTDIGDGDKFDEQLRDQLTRDVRAQHKAEHGEVQEQGLDVNYICQILARYSNTKK